MFEKVLLPVDFSKPSQLLLSRVSELQELGCRQLLILHVANPSSSKKKLSKKQKVLEQWMSKIELGLEPQILIKPGAPARTITTLAKKHRASLIYIGGKGRNFWQEAFLGSTVLDVVRMTRVPTLVEKFDKKIKEAASIAKARQLSPFRSLLYVTDFSYNSSRALPYLHYFTGKIVRIHLLYIGKRGPDPSVDQENYEKAYMELDELEANLLSKGSPAITKSHKIGSIPRTASRLAGKESIDLILMGKLKAGTIKRFMFGNIGAAVARVSPCPVLFIP